jgi:putative transcriptional regulator
MIVSRVKEVAHERGITTVKELAARAKVAYNTAHDLYNGRATRIGFEVLDRFCRALQAQPGDLLVWVDDNPPS